MQGSKTFFFRTHRVAVRIIAACLLLAALSVAFAQMAFSADTSNAQGETFTVDYTDPEVGVSGSITYKVTQAAPLLGGNDSLGEAMVMDATGYCASEDSPELVFDTVENGQYRYAVTAVNYQAFKNNTNIYHVKFQRDLTGVADGYERQLDIYRRAIGYSAFTGCTNLASVEFACSKLNGIGAQAFYDCESLSQVTFADDLIIYCDDGGIGIGENAFFSCAFTSITIPPIMSAKRTGDYYRVYSHDYDTTPEDRDESGYQGCWHLKNTYFGIEQAGIGTSAFQRTPLETVIFKAGNETGMFAYWSASGAGFRYLSTLKSVVFEDVQAYYGNPNRSMNNGSVKNVWGLTGDEDVAVSAAEPNFYYSVDFYVTQADAEADDAYASGRIARVEYKRGTPVDAVQAADSEALDGYVYPSPQDYAEDGYADGTTPDPNAMAIQAQQAGVEGFEDADQHQWIWMLGDTQSRRNGLSDSCDAYLIRADDLSSGRLDTSDSTADQIGTFYQLCDQNLSQGSVQNSAFDYKRYYDTESTYVFDEETIETHINLGNNNMSEGQTPWFTLKSAGSEGVLSQLTFYDGEGNKVDISDSSKFSITFYSYNESTGELEETVMGEGDDSSGPILMAVTPLEGSGYSTNSVFKEWLLVAKQYSSVLELYCDDAADTWQKAVYANGEGYTNPVSFDIEKGYVVTVSSGDLTAALAAVSYAGLCQGAISTVTSDSNYGFGIAWPGAFYSTGYIYGAVDVFSHAKGESLSDYVASNYTVFNKNRTRWGVDKSFKWGNTALLVNPSYAADVATAASAYAYAKSAPIFYTEKDGSVSEATATCLTDFSNVLVLGDENMVPEETLDAIDVRSVTRMSGMSCGSASANSQEVGSACSLSLAMAQRLLKENKVSVSCVSIIVGQGADITCDAASAMNLAGHEGGVVLTVASSADAKRVAQFVRDNRDDITEVRLFGRDGAPTSSSSFDFLDCLKKTWYEDGDAPDIANGDTLELYGALFDISSGNTLQTKGSDSHIWGTNVAPAGQYPYGVDSSGQSVLYTLEEDYKTDKAVLSVPKAKSGLVYTGSPQVGVKAGEGYLIEGGSATNAGTYTASVLPEEGYCWDDGSSRCVKVSWTIATASLNGAKVKLSSNKLDYTGRELRPAVTKVTLASGAVVSSNNFDVSYRNNIKKGTATVSVVGKRNCADSATATFQIVSAANSNGGSTAGNTSGSGGSSSGSTVGNGNNGVNDSGGSNNKGAMAKSVKSNLAVGIDESSDDWTYFAPPEATTTEAVSSIQIETPPAINIAILVACCLAFAAAILYSVRSRKETDDLLEGTDVA